MEERVSDKDNVTTNPPSTRGTDPPQITPPEKHQATTATITTADTESEYVTDHMKGFPLYMLTAGICISLFLSTLESTIVSTSLVAVSDSLSGFEARNWVATAYFLTYTGFLVIYAKLASIFGSKTLFLFALGMFTVFSIGCGLVGNITQLIILRAFQGIGGSGIYSMVLVLAPRLVPRTEYGKYIGVISSVFALASIVGPLIGGAISNAGAWRWIFLLNGPPGVVAIAIVAIYLPSSKVEGNPTWKARFRDKFSRKAARRVDIPGAVSLLAASVLLVFALESAGTRYPWNSAPIISTLILSGVLWIVFIAWEIYLERSNTLQEPIFPMGLLKDRGLASMMFTTFLMGFPFVAILFAIPQHAQVVYSLPPIQAGLSVLPILLTSPAATAASGILTSNFNVPPAHLIIIGSIIQVIGVGLMISIPLTGNHISAQQYGFEVIMGIGFGLTLSTALTLAQLIVSKEDAGVVMGALTQIRVLGGTVALALCSAVLSNQLRGSLDGVLSPAEIRGLSEQLGAINSLDPERAAKVKLAFALGYNREFQILTGFSGAALIAALFLISRHPATVRGVDKAGVSGNLDDSKVQTPADVLEAGSNSKIV